MNNSLIDNSLQKAPRRFGQGGSRGLLATVTASLIVLVGCSSAPAEDEKEQPATAIEVPGIGVVEVNEAAAALLPERYSAGLNIASTIPHPPFIDFAESGVRDEFVGVDFDLLTAIGARLGTTITYHAMPFDGLIPGLQAGNFDVISGLADLKTRQETVTFVDYSKTGAAIMTGTETTDIETLADLCGRKAAAVKDTTLRQILVDYSAASCGDKPMEVVEYPDEAASIQSVISGATDALLTAKVNAIMLAQELSDKLQAIEDPDEPNGYKANPNGIGVLNANADLAEAIKVALQSLIDDGTYLAIYEQWDLGSIGVESAVINGAEN